MVETATGKLRELQLAEAEMLHDFKELCEKNGLTYFLDYGTLLGAVRHNGFIPWDDDVDVTMPYEDYVKFLEIAQDQLGDEYFIQTSETDLNYHYSFAKIRKNGTTLLDHYQKKWNIHHGIWIDVFPIVEMNPGIELKIKKNIIKISNYFLMDNFLDIHTDEFETILGKFGVKCLKLFHKIPRNKRLKFRKSIQKCIFNAKNKKCRSAVWMGITQTYSSDFLSDTAKVTFEGEEYNTFGQYQKKLELMYGDYMQLPPEDARIGHGSDTIIDVNNNYTLYIDK